MCCYQKAQASAYHSYPQSTSLAKNLRAHLLQSPVTNLQLPAHLPSRTFHHPANPLYLIILLARLFSTSEGPYVPLFWTILTPLPLSHFVTHLGPPNFSSTCIHTYVFRGVCLSSRKFLTGGFCLGWFLSISLCQNTSITTEG